ncbi:hypothetical protein [Streptomyces sp. CLCI03]
MMDFLKEHATILLAVFTGVVAFAGTWLGAKVQAGGGVAQAKAAKEAAETAATATLQAVREQTDRAAAAAHAAALRDQRTRAIADLLRTTREFTRTLDQLYREPGTDAIDRAYNDFFHAQGAVELVAPAALTAASTHVVQTAQQLAGLARNRAEAERAREHLANMNPLMPEYVGVGRAREALAAYRAACLAQADDMDMVTLFGEADSAVSQLPGLTSDEQSALIIDCMRPALGPLLDRHRREHSEAMTAFINQARAVLGVND